MTIAAPAERRRSVLWGLTARELRGDLIILCIILWAVGVANYARPGARLWSGQVKGTDFLHFYTLGAAVDRGRSDLLYNPAGLATLQVTLVPDSADVRYLPVYGPQVALMFAPFARLPYLAAFAAWTAATLAAYGLCLFWVWRRCPRLRHRAGLVVLGAAGFYPFWNLINHGQNSALPLLSLTGAWIALRAERPWLAGFALGTLAVKPQLGVAFACLCLAARQWRIIGGAIVAALVQALAVVLVLGSAPLLEYLRVLRNASAFAAGLEPRLEQLHSLRGFWMLLLPNPWSAVLYIVSSVLVLWLAIRLWRGQAPLGVRYAGACVATVLVAPHLTIYDLTLLAPALLLSIDAALTRWDEGDRTALLPRSILATYTLPCVPLAFLLRLQPSVLAMTALLWALESGSRRRAGSGRI